jgi:D-3-phosphoglycerate dehydrogenase / 2-oxoglutarate reductase
MELGNVNLIIDFDSTFVKVEALDELAAISLRKRKDRKSVLAEIKKTTELGMEGAISFPESLSRRFDLLSANEKHVKKLISLLRKNVSYSIIKNKKFFKKNKKNIYIISGGFEEYIIPVVAPFGIGRSNVLANKFIFNKEREIVGFDKKRLLAQKNGKSKQVRKLELKGEVWVVGDGFTDFEIKKSGAADKFIAYAENVTRGKVLLGSDHVCGSFCSFLRIAKNKYHQINKPA